MSTQYLNFIFSRKDQLKHRLQRDYPELSFHAPVKKNQIERIYYEAATAINRLGSDIDTSEISSSLSDLDHLPSPLQIYKQDSSTLTLLYKSKLMIIIAI